MGNFSAKFTVFTLMASLLFTMASPPALASYDEDEDEAGECSAEKSAQTNYDTNQQAIERAKTAIPYNPNTISRLEGDSVGLQNKLNDAKAKCARREKKLGRERDKCNKQMQETPGLYKWNESKKTCEDLQAKNSKANPNAGECNDAEMMKGNNLKGENCKVAEDAVRDVKTRQEAVGQTGLVATQVYSQMQASQTTGAQADVQARQSNVLKGLAMVKIASGMIALSGAATLKAAAGGAEEASTNIKSAYSNLTSYCGQNGIVEKMSSEQCFYQNAATQGITPDAKNYATFERMKNGADQSQEAADKANALAKTAMITGAAETAVGIQALIMARQSAQTATNFAPPPMLAGVSVPLNQMSGSSGGTPGLGSGGPIGSPVSGDVDGVSLGGTDGGQLKGGLIGGRPQAFNSYKPEKSSVSGVGGVGGGGGGGRPGGGASRKGGGKGNTTSGEYTNSGAGPGGSRSGGGGKEASAGANPLEEMMKKLFPPNADGKPVVEETGRGMASNENAAYEDADAPVTSSELSIFEQVSTRYRSLNGAGQI